MTQQRSGSVPAGCILLKLEYVVDGRLQRGFFLLPLAEYQASVQLHQEGEDDAS